MKLTKEQRRAVLHPGHTMLDACPGSGKTRAVVARIINGVDAVRGSPRRVACITYTNAATDEILHRLRQRLSEEEASHCSVSTIHSFCLENILRHFYWQLKPFADGFTVLPSDSEQYQEYVSQICRRHRLGSRAKPDFELLSREPDGTPILPETITNTAANDFWRTLEADRLVDFSSIVYYSHLLVAKSALLPEMLASRYAAMIVDEFQDTSALQVRILEAIAARGRTTFFIVGDPYQSIYGFAGAKPELMGSFARTLDANAGFALTGNFRSSHRIVRHAQSLCPRTPPMVAVGAHAATPWPPQHIHGESAFEALIDHFLPALDANEISYGDAAILAPSWLKLLPLGRRLREFGVGVVGPGARPYRHSNLFAGLAEIVCAYIEEPSPKLRGHAERELFRLISNATGRADFAVFTFRGRRTVQRLLERGTEIRERREGAIAWLREASCAFSKVLAEEDFLPLTIAKLLTESVDQMVKEMIGHDLDIENLRVTDLGLFARPDKSLKLMTIHRSKGLEFDAVAIVDIHEGKLPHYKSVSSDDLLAERRRLYVAITRAKRLLMYVTDAEDSRNRPSRFLDHLPFRTSSSSAIIEKV